MRLVSSSDVIGHLARWAVQQHPYKRPEGLFELVQDVIKKCEIAFKDGVMELPMRWFGTSQKLLTWLRDEMAGHPTLTAWNTPRSGVPDGFSSRYGGAKPENDFIDIDALWMNVARCVWDDAAEFEKPPNNVEQVACLSSAMTAASPAGPASVSAFQTSAPAPQ